MCLISKVITYYIKATIEVVSHLPFGLNSNPNNCFITIGSANLLSVDEINGNVFSKVFWLHLKILAHHSQLVTVLSTLKWRN
jgi:hypothetical protein